MLPVKLGNVIAATTPIIVNDRSISAIVKAPAEPVPYLAGRLAVSLDVSVEERPPPPALDKTFWFLIISSLSLFFMYHVKKHVKRSPKHGSKLRGRVDPMFSQDSLQTE